MSETVAIEKRNDVESAAGVTSCALQLQGNAPFEWSVLNIDNDSVTIRCNYNNSIILAEDLKFGQSKDVNLNGGGNGSIHGTLSASRNHCSFNGNLAMGNTIMILTMFPVIAW